MVLRERLSSPRGICAPALVVEDAATWCVLVSFAADDAEAGAEEMAIMETASCGSDGKATAALVAGPEPRAGDRRMGFGERHGMRSFRMILVLDLRIDWRSW